MDWFFGIFLYDLEKRPFSCWRIDWKLTNLFLSKIIYKALIINYLTTKHLYLQPFLLALFSSSPMTDQKASK
jgi:hypothetical protein